MRDLTPQRQLILLLIVLVAAFSLRLWGTGYGLPYSYHNDEYHEVMRAFQLGAGSFNIGRIGKGGLYLLLFVEYGIYFVVLKVLGVVNSTADFAAEFVRDQSAFYYMGRVTVVIFGTVTVLLAYLITRRAYVAGAGVLAATFLAVNAMHVDMSQRIMVDVPMVCLAAATLLMAIRIATNGFRKHYIWAAVFASLATTTKIPAIVLLVPLLIAHTYNSSHAGGGVRHWFRSQELWIAAAVFGAILLATNPGIVFIYKYVSLFSSGNGSEAAMLTEEGEEFLLGTERPNLFLYYLTAMRSSMGWPLFIASMGGLIHALLKRTPADVLLLSFAFVFFVAISTTTSDLYYARYVLPVSLVALILAARMLYDLWLYSRRSNVTVMLFGICILIAIPAYQSTFNSYLYTQTDTRTLAKQWIEENIAPGSKILLEGAKIAPVRNTVQLHDTAENLRRSISYWRSEEPRQAEYLRVRLQVLEGTTFDLVLVPRSAMDDLQTYRDMGVEYFIVTPRFDRLSRGGQRSALLAHDLRNSQDVELVKKFEEDKCARPGPTVEIFGFRDASPESE